MKGIPRRTVKGDLRVAMFTKHRGPSVLIGAARRLRVLQKNKTDRMLSMPEKS